MNWATKTLQRPCGRVHSHRKGGGARCFSLMDWDSLMDRQGAQSQKEGNDDRGEVKELGGTPRATLKSNGPLGLPSGSGVPGNP